MPPEDMEISAQELISLLPTQDFCIVDVRERFEVMSGILPRALHIPLGQLPARVSELPEGKPVIVYCAHGMRSFQGAYYLRTQGFEGAKSLAGGMAYWSGVGGPVVPPTELKP